ncbi:extracellular solute-binding protein [Pseudoalteromonas luteoviolacea]|uniref:extracellular solute-binding protein n=1 Tax=Pseudoalteromonas luteoviolacea TaxID=43657 RepID=UPI001F171AC0|nr:extracellular solute-binding protein [Pseudoalteromonas luteoviolacea]MCF6442697.1 extracellular solute-binding protein [Pseudoalteromonas luteoviolacea]
MIKSKLCCFYPFLLLSTQVLADDDELNVYSFRKYELIKPMLQAFEQHSGVKVNLVNGKSHFLLSRLKADGAQSRADVILSSDLVQLSAHRALLQPMTELKGWSVLPDVFKDPDQHWVSLSMRTRALFTRKNDTSSSFIPTYFAQFSEPQMQGKFCVRDWRHSYNKTLFASLLSGNREQDTQWIKNANKLLAKRPSGGDRDQLRGLAKGQCQYALANHYYWHMMKQSNNKQEVKIASQLAMHFLQMANGTTPVSTTTAAIAKHAPNKKNALAFIDFLLLPQTQKMYAQLLNEFPVVAIEGYQLPFKPALENINFSLEYTQKANKIPTL